MQKETRKALAALLFIALLLPSAWYAWRNREMPQFGQATDDAIYFVSAKSMAQGTGYRILSLPGEPYQTKYPPVLPWLLSVAWRINPNFPANLTVATAIQWSVIPLLLTACLLWYRRVGLSAMQTWIAVGLMAVSPYTVAFGAGIFTEVVFTLFLLLSLLGCEKARTAAGYQGPFYRQSWFWAAAAGMLAGLGYLTRAAGIAAVISGPAVFLLWKQRREAAAFVLGMLPAILGWAAWARLHHNPQKDLVSLYYTDYLSFQFLDVRWHDASGIFYKNITIFSDQVGAFFFPAEPDSFFWHLMRMTCAVAAIAGLARRFKNPVLAPFLAFGLISAIQQLVWLGPPNLRLMYPMAPLFVTGLLFEGDHLVKLLRGTWKRPELSQRIAAGLVSGAAVVLMGWGLWMQGFMTFELLPAMTQDSERVREESRAAYEWINQHAAPGATVLSVNPSVYLQTGHHSVAMVILPIHWYREDQPKILAPFAQLAQFSAEYKVAYIFLHSADYSRLNPGHGEETRKAVEAISSLKPVFNKGEATVFEPVAVNRAGLTY